MKDIFEYYFTSLIALPLLSDSTSVLDCLAIGNKFEASLPSRCMHGRSSFAMPLFV